MMENKELVEEIVRLCEEYFILQDEYHDIREYHQCYKEPRIWIDCKNILIDNLEEDDRDNWVLENSLLGYEDIHRSIQASEYVHSRYSLKYPIVIKHIKQSLKIECKSCWTTSKERSNDLKKLIIEDIKKKDYPKEELEKAISYYENRIKQYQKGIAVCKNLKDENYYSNFEKELKDLLLKYVR